MTKIQDLAALGDIKGIQNLLENGVNIDVDDVNLGTALYQAIWKNQQSTVEWLIINGGADVNALIFDNQWRALIFAVVCNNKEAFEFLLKCNDIDINAQNKKGETALHYCIKEKRTDLGQMLLTRKDLDPNVQNSNGRTALMEAVVKENLVIVTGLLNHVETNAAMKGNLQDSALLLTRDVKNKKIKEAIENAVCEYLNTPIGKVLREDKDLRQYCERIFNLKVRTIEDIGDNRVDEKWLSWKVPIKQSSHVKKAWSILHNIASQKNIEAVAVAEAVTDTNNNANVPMAKVI